MKKILSFFVILLLVLSSVNVSFGAESCKTEEIPNASKLVYSPDSKGYAYVLTKNNGKQVVIRDGVESKEYDSISNLIYSPMGDSFAYVVKKENGKEIVVKDGVEGKEYNFLYILTYSPNGKSFAYIAEKDRKMFLIRDGIEGIKYSVHGDIHGNLVYSPDGESIAFVVSKDGKAMVVKDGIESRGYDTLPLSLTYSLNGKSLVFVIFNNEGGFFVKDGIESKVFDRIGKIIPSPDGKSFIFILKQNGKFVAMKDFKKTDKFDYIEYDVYPSYDSGYQEERYAYIVSSKNGKKIIVIDGVESIEYDKVISLIYSSDEESFIYHAYNNGKEIVVKDKTENESNKSNSSIYNKVDLKEEIRKLMIKYKSDYTYIVSIISPNNKDFSLAASGNGKTILVKVKCLPNSVIASLGSGNITKTKSQLVKQLILSKRELKKTVKLKSYIYKIDLIVQKLPKVKLERLMGKLKKIDTNLVKFRKYKNMLDYLEAKVGLELLK